MAPAQVDPRGVKTKLRDGRIIIFGGALLFEWKGSLCILAGIDSFLISSVDKEVARQFPGIGLFFITVYVT